MSQTPMPPETMQGYAPPSVTQFSVFLDNKVGKLFDLVEAFDGSTCEICAISVHEASDHAVVRLITNDSRLTRDLLRAEGLPFSELDVLVVELGSGHSLSTMCLHFHQCPRVKGSIRFVSREFMFILSYRGAQRKSVKTSVIPK